VRWRSEIAALSQTLPSGIQVNSNLVRPASFDTAINNVSGSLIEVIVIVSVVMVLVPDGLA